MGEPQIERIFEPSHIRRGRLATSPTFFVNMPDGSRWKFQRKKDARRFIDAGGCHHSFDLRPGRWCCECDGVRVVSPSSSQSSEGT